MPKCFYRDCKSTSKSKNTSSTLRYYPFPKPITNIAKCLLWIELCGNEKLNVSNITKNTYICEKHFVGEKNADSNPISFYENMAENSRNMDVGRIIELSNSSSSNNDEYDKIISSLENPQEDNNEENDHSYIRNPGTSVTMLDKETQTDSTEINEDVHHNLFSFQALSQSNHFKYHTGLSVGHFEAMYNFLDPSVMPMLKYTKKNNTRVRWRSLQRLTDKDKLCLTLIRLKMGFTLKELSIFCSLSMSHVSVIFNTWIQFIRLQCCRLKTTLVQASRNKQEYEMPACFQAIQEKVTVILDTAELKMQKLSENCRRKRTGFASYEDYDSVKFLVGVSAAGAVVYNSEGFDGSISNAELFQSSDLQSFLQEGDVIVAGSGFAIQNICDENKYKLLTPPPLAYRQTLTAEERIFAKQITKGHGYVKRAIRLIKSFKILAKPIPISMLSQVPNIFDVICFLVNFEKPPVQT